MRFQVSGPGTAHLLTEDVDEALAYGASVLYPPQGYPKDFKQKLLNMQPVRWAYGFNTVEITPYEPCWLRLPGGGSMPARLVAWGDWRVCENTFATSRPCKVDCYSPHSQRQADFWLSSDRVFSDPECQQAIYAGQPPDLPFGLGDAMKSLERSLEGGQVDDITRSAWKVLAAWRRT